MKYNLWKNVGNLGRGILLAGLIWSGYQVYKTRTVKDNNLVKKHASKACYGVLGSLVLGKGVFIFSQCKLNKLEKDVKNE